MSTPKEMKSYPAQYLEIVDRLQQKPEEVIEVSFETPAMAYKFALNFRSFKSAALKEGLTTLYSELPALSVTIQKEPPKVVVMHKNYTPEALQIKKALGL